jgi:hypothetical protein
MSGLIEGAPAFAVTWLLAEIGLTPDVLVIAVICAGLGAIILSLFTYPIGVLAYPLNFCILFAGAVAANLMLTEVRLPLGLSIERPIILSIGGMIIVSLIALIVMPRDRQSG